MAAMKKKTDEVDNQYGTSGEKAAAEAATQPTAAYSAAKRPALKSKAGALGFSWNNLREAAQPKKMQVIPGTLDASDPNAKPNNEHNEFSQDELEFQWMSMCNRMPQKLSGIAARMKNMTPTITDFPKVEVVVENQIMLDQMQVIKGSIQNTLKLYLHNNGITLDMRLAEHNEQVKVLSRREQFEEMSKQNPAIEKLRGLLDLELA